MGAKDKFAADLDNSRGVHNMAMEHYREGVKNVWTKKSSAIAELLIWYWV
jgi:hypothetical protein